MDDEPESHAAYRVVWRDEPADRYVAVCPDGTGRLELGRDDLIVHELDTRELARQLAVAMRLVSDFGEVQGVPCAARIGARDPLTDDENWVYMALQARSQDLSETITRLSIRHERPFVLLTPSRSSWRPWVEGAQTLARVVAMDEAFVVDRHGRWSETQLNHSYRHAASILGRTGAAAEPPPRAPMAYVPDRNEMTVLRVLAKARTLMVQDEIVVVTEEGERPLSRKTVGKVLKSLDHHGLIECPSGSRKGVKLTDEGHRLAASIASGSH